MGFGNNLIKFVILIVILTIDNYVKIKYYLNIIQWEHIRKFVHIKFHSSIQIQKDANI